MLNQMDRQEIFSQVEKLVGGKIGVGGNLRFDLNYFTREEQDKEVIYTIISFTNGIALNQGDIVHFRGEIDHEKGEFTLLGYEVKA